MTAATHLPVVQPATPRMKQSASRIGKWMACNRKAGWEYFAGYDEGPKPAADFGVAVHAILETIDPDGTPDLDTREGRVAGEAMPHLRSLAHLWDIDREPHFEFQYKRRIWHGYIDVRTKNYDVLVDWKTSSDPKKWGKNEIELLHDPQAMLYAFFAMENNPNLDEVWLKWIYLKTAEPIGSHVVSLTVNREHAQLAMDALESYAVEMQAAADNCPPASDPVAVHKYVLTLQPSWGQCEAFRGCPHKQRCGAPMFGPKGEKPVNLRNRMNELLKGAPNPFAAPPAAPPQQAPEPTVLSTVGRPGQTANDVMQRLAAAKQVEDQEVTKVMPTAPPSDAIAQAVSGQRPRNDPYAPPGTPAPVRDADPVNPPVKRGRGRPRKDGLPTVEAPKTEPMLPVAKPVEPPVEYLVNNTTIVVHNPAAEAQAPQAEDPKPVETVEAEDARPIENQAPAGTFLIDTLLVGCTARGVVTTQVEIVDFDRVVAEAKILIGPRDYRLYKFGGGNGLLLDAVQKIVQSKPKISIMCVVDPRTPEATLCLSYLRGAARDVVESVRQ